MSDTNNGDEEEKASSGFGFWTVAAVSAGVGAIGYFMGRNTTSSPHCNATSSPEPSRYPPSQKFLNKAVNCDKCSICLDSMDTMVLPCKHSFHTNCVRAWLAENPICPICWAPVNI